jgi:sarcosine oxidase
MHIAVIGRGLIGSATARHLAGQGMQVTLVGPDEPADKATHRGVFASHYDEGRITRRLESVPFWSAVSEASMARYARIEAAGGIPFFTRTGAMMTGPADSALMTAVAKVREDFAIPSDRLKGTELSERFPFFRFGPGVVGFHEPGGGHISPRRLVAAQTAAAAASGVAVLREEVAALAPGPKGFTVSTPAATITADRVILAAGGFTNALLPKPLPISVYARTVAFFEVDGDEAARLAAMPTLVQQTDRGREPYLLPPIRYPDGRIYLKLGGDPVDVPLPDADAAKRWFRTDGSAEVGQALTAHIRALMPDLAICAVTTARCVTTFTPWNRPLIDEIAPGLTVATAGCARGAKCSDELGRLAAMRSLGRDEPLLEETRLK